MQDCDIFTDVFSIRNEITLLQSNQRNTINAITVGVMNNTARGSASQSVCVRNRSSRSTIGKTSMMDKFLTMFKGSPNAPSMISLSNDQVFFINYFFFA